MANLKINIGSREIVYSGVIVSHMDAAISLYPFERDAEYRVNINIIPIETNKPTRSWSSSGPENNIELYFEVFFTPFGFGATGPNFNFASDDQYEYYFDCAVAFAGKIDLYTKIAAITVTRKAK
ncbi:hypothetical protein [Methylobacterium sp. JK268]